MIHIVDIRNPKAHPEARVEEIRPGWTTCQHCAPRSTDVTCCAEFPGPLGVICCRPAGHDGPHWACGYQAHSHPIAAWTDDVDPAAVEEALRAPGRPV